MQDFNIEQVPPHSSEVELRTIGAMLCDERAADIGIESLNTNDFYSPQYRKMFEIIVSLRQEKVLPDESVVASRLKLLGWDREYIKEVIGDAILETSGGASIETYCYELKGKAADRALLEDGQNKIKAALLGRGREFVLDKPRRPSLGFKDYLAIDTENDPNCLLGKRWLCRGGSLMVIGQSGIGKSSFTGQAATVWALGNSLFGITPLKPLKSLIFQAENDPGDIAEQFRGAVNGLQLGANIEELHERVVIECVDDLTGTEFTKFVRSKVIEHKPDLAWIDPLLSYLGEDASDQKACGKFLRGELNPIAHEHGCAMVIVHHTGKPKEPKEMKAMSGSDYAYLGLGSSELTNWPRAILVLREIDGGTFELRAPKRGKRSGMTASDEPDAVQETLIYLKHGDTGICWKRASFDPEMDKLSIEIDAILEKYPDTGFTYSLLSTHIETSISVSLATAKRFIQKHGNKFLKKVGHTYLPKKSKVSFGINQENESA